MRSMPPARLAWMDTLRGLAIVAVISMHARVITFQVTGVDLDLVHAVDRALAPVRMPLLMVLSGVLLARSLAKGRRHHYRGKLRGILWPYAVWMGLYVSHRMLDSALAGEPLPWYVLRQAFYNPAGYIWFLGYLFAFHVVAGAMSARVRTAAVPVAFVVHHVVVAQELAGVDLQRFLWLFPYFLLGDALARAVRGRVPAPVAAGANRLSLRPLAAVGRASIVYYVPHMMVMTYVVPLLWRAPGASPLLVWLLTVVLVLAVGWGMSLVQHAPGWRWLYAWQASPRVAVAPEPPVPAAGSQPLGVHVQLAPA